MLKGIIICLILLALSLTALPARAACTTLNVYLHNTSDSKNIIMTLIRAEPLLELAATVGPHQMGHLHDCAPAWYFDVHHYDYTVRVTYEDERSHTRGACICTANSFMFWPMWTEFRVCQQDGVQAHADFHSLAWKGSVYIEAD